MLRLDRRFRSSPLSTRSFFPLVSTFASIQLRARPTSSLDLVRSSSAVAPHSSGPARQPSRLDQLLRSYFVASRSFVSLFKALASLGWLARRECRLDPATRSSSGGARSCTTLVSFLGSIFHSVRRRIRLDRFPCSSFNSSRSTDSARPDLRFDRRARSSNTTPRSVRSLVKVFASITSLARLRQGLDPPSRSSLELDSVSAFVRQQRQLDPQLSSSSAPTRFSLQLFDP